MSSSPKLAYLTALYPALSHTFIMREVITLRSLGFEVETCSMRRPDSFHLNAEEDHAAADTTFYAVETGKNPVRLLAAAAQFLRQPRRFFGAMALAFRTAPPGVKGGLKQAAYFAEALVLSRHLINKGVTHLHNHFADPSANVAMLTSALTGIPFSYTLHGPAELYEPEKWQLREKTARAAFVSCISHFCRAQAMYFSKPEDWHKLHIIHCGVIPERYDHPVDPAPSTSALRLIFVGRLTPIKGVRVLLEALATARARHSNVQLTLVGDGDDRQALETLAAPLGAAVQFVGALSQQGVADALAQADALVLPSFAEGLPVVLMEAMAAGKPVICTQVAGVRELVEDGTSGFVVPAGDASSLSDRICDLAELSPLARVEMGQQGQAKVRQDFDIRIEAARIGALFAGQHHDMIRPDPYEPEA